MGLKKFFHKVGHAVSHVVHEVGHEVGKAATAVGHVFTGTHHQSIADLPVYTTINNTGVVNVNLHNIKDHTHSDATPTAANGMTNGFETIHTTSGKNIIINNQRNPQTGKYG